MIRSKTELLRDAVLAKLNNGQPFLSTYTPDDILIAAGLDEDDIHRLLEQIDALICGVIHDRSPGGQPHQMDGEIAL